MITCTMKSAVILCNGEFPGKEYPRYLLRTADIIICCDSARNVERLRRLGLEPAFLVGDMDSTPRKVQESLAGRIVKVEEQDDNDLAKAFAMLRERYPEIVDIHILGAGGRNEAHTVGNLGWLLEWERRSLEKTGSGLAARGINLDMVSDWSTAFAVSPAARRGSYPACLAPSAASDGEAAASDRGGVPPSGSPHHPFGTVPPLSDRGCHVPQEEPLPVELFVGEGRRISFFATDPTLRIKSQGLQWPLDGVDLSRWWAATLNRAASDTVTLRFNHAAPLLVILD